MYRRPTAPASTARLSQKTIRNHVPNILTAPHVTPLTQRCRKIARAALRRAAPRTNTTTREQEIHPMKKLADPLKPTDARHDTVADADMTSHPTEERLPSIPPARTISTANSISRPQARFRSDHRSRHGSVCRQHRL